MATKSGQLHFLSKNSGFSTHKVESGFSLGAPPGLGHNQGIGVDKNGTNRYLKGVLDCREVGRAACRENV